MKLTKAAEKKLADLTIQSMLFDMDIDLETATLVPKTVTKEQSWLTKWKNKRSDADFDEYFDIDKE